MTAQRTLCALTCLAVLCAVLCAVRPPSAARADDATVRVRPTWPAEWPMDPAPITQSTWPQLPPPLPAAPPATEAAARVVERVGVIQRTQTDAAYQHHLDVRERVGRYRWNCSGMVSWVIHRASPRAGRALGDGRPTARGIHRVIANAPIDRSRRGWRRIDHIEDVRAGDVFAWRTPAGSPSVHSGHTGFALERARPVPGLRDAYAIRVADSIVGPHQEDTRPHIPLEGEPPPGGLGTGVMVFLTDGRGHATHYGWHGTRTAGYMRTPVLFGRIE